MEVDLSRTQVLACVPHDDCALFISSARLDPGKSVSALVSLDGSEGCFAGHYPGRPILPAATLLEMLGQAGAVLISSFESSQKFLLMASVERFRILRPTIPPASLVLHVQVDAVRSGLAFLSGRATSSDGRVIATVRFVIAKDRADG